jgi:hypothetical protein
MMGVLQRGLAVPCFAEDPSELIELGVAAERAGFDGFFLWAHRVPAADIAAVRSEVARLRGSASGFDFVVWAEVAAVPADVPELAGDYVSAGATWWIETAKPEPRWWEGVQARVAQHR